MIEQGTMPDHTSRTTPQMLLLGGILALIIGGLYYYPMAFLWGYIAAHNPLIEVFLELVRKGMPTAFYVLIYTQDFFINLLMMWPLAIIIFRIRPMGNWVYLVLALFACQLASVIHLWPNILDFIVRVGVWQQILTTSLTIAPALLAYHLIHNRHKQDQ